MKQLRTLVSMAMLVVGLVAITRPASAVVPPPGGQYHAVAAARVLDTRATGAVPALSTHALTVLGKGGVPATGVSAVSLHVTAVDGSPSGYLTVWPQGAARPTASLLNFVTGSQPVSNSIIVPVGTGGVVDFYNGGALGVQVIVDVVGYVDTLGGDARGAYAPLTPARLMDTRIGLGANTIAPGATVQLPIVGHGGVPATNNGFGFSAAALNVTAVTPTSGYVTVWPDNQSRPGTSNINLGSGVTRANLAISGIGTGGGVKIYNGTGTPLKLVVDIDGYFSGGVPNSAAQFAPVAPTRILDTRVGVGVPAHALAAGATLTVNVPAVAPLSAVALNVVAVGATHSGYLTAWAHGAARPSTSNVNFGTDPIATLSLIRLGTDHQVSIYNGSGGPVQVVADEFGYVTGP
jgi:hypothetical protein